jgi:L-asparaginase II
MDSIPPALARVLRGGRTESVHRGDIAVVDEEGRLVASSGDPGRRVYVRSAAKPFQAMPLLESGGERAFDLDSDAIALMCASHGGEPRHVRVARRLLRKGGFRVEDLACGAHLPMHERSARRLIARGEKPSPLHNNCSGKHAGLLLACRLEGYDAAGYVLPEHPLQRRVLDRISQLAGIPAADVAIAVDGCSLPVFRLPLAALALAYARLLARDGRGSSPVTSAVRRRITRAMWDSPDMVAGEGRFTSDLLRAGQGRWIGKEGAEGVYAMGVAAPRRVDGPAVGIAFKIEDGSSRSRDAVTLEILERIGRLPSAAARALAAYRRPVVRSVRGDPVGAIVPDAGLERLESARFA